MDFKAVLFALIEKFQKHNIRYALIGGFAMGLWGMGRTTVDIDFLVHKDDMNKVDRIMNELDYECKYRTENVSQYVSPLRVFGEVDFLHAFREATLSMLQRAEEKTVFEKLSLRVLCPEDLIGLKLQSIKNSPERKATEMDDILFLVQTYKDRMDWSLIEGYVKILDMEEIYRDLLEKR
jgi:hypothetical protein